MQRKAYVSGVVALLAALLAGCTGSSDDGGTTDDSNPGDTGTASPAAQPGKYTSLPEPCGAVGRDTLDSMLPGLKQIADPDQRDKAYEGEATQTFNTDRKVGCGWKVQATDATDHLLVDFERVVSYDNAVSDDNQAEQLFAEKQAAADLPEPTVSASGDSDDTTSPSAGASPSPSASASPASPSPSGSTSPSSGPSATDTATPTDLQPRVLTDLGDEAFLDDELSSSGSTAKQRTVTVAFRTSNVIVTIEYMEQPTTVGVVPDSEEMQDNARKLAAQLAGSLSS